MSGQVLTIEDIQPSEAGSCEWEVRRYNGIPSASGTAANSNLWKTDTTQSAPTFGAKYATVDADLDLTGLTCTWHRDVMHEAGYEISPEDAEDAWQAFSDSAAKRDLRRLRRRLERYMLDDTPKRLTRGWVD